MYRSLVLAVLVASTWAATVRKTLRLSWEEGAPNGQSRELIYTNGQFPAPPLILDEDDDAEITVCNDMQRNVTIHWHGLAQPGTPWSDGVPGLTQKPILPGEVFVYRFKATPAGTHWYHSHDRMSLVDGLYGAIWIKPKEDQTDLWARISDDPEDIRALAKAAAKPELIVVSDWSRYTSEEYWKANVESGLQIFCVDSILINGVGELYCPPHEYLINQTQPDIQKYGFGEEHVSDKGCFPFRTTIEGGPWNYTARPELIPPHMVDGCVPSAHRNATFIVDPADRWVSLNFISAATTAQFVFTVDDHDFWVYEVDGNYVNPRKFVTATMSAGETFSVMMRLDKPPGAYKMRVPDSGATQVVSAFADFIYKGAEHVPKTSATHYTPYAFENDTMAPWPSSLRPRPGPADEEYLLVMGRIHTSTNYTMNYTYMYPVNFQADRPLLFYPNATVGTPDENLVIRTKNGSWVDLILQISTLPGDLAAFEHFMHKHGSKTWRVGYGHGVWNYSSVSEALAERPQDFNFENPGYRDMDEFRSAIATELGIDPGGIHLDVPFDELGMDPLAAIAVLEVVNRNSGTELPASLFRDCKCLADIGKRSGSTNHNAYADTIICVGVYAEESGVADFWTNVYPTQKRLVLAYVVEALSQLERPLDQALPGETYEAPENILKRHEKLMKVLFDILVDGTILERVGSKVHSDTHRLLNVTGPHLAACLVGSMDPIKLLFGSSLGRDLLFEFYTNAPMSIAASKQLSDLFRRIFTNTEDVVEILEIGAGFGGTTRFVIDMLVRAGIRFKYTFTDISASFFKTAKKRFSELIGPGSALEYEVLDVEKPVPHKFRGGIFAVVEFSTRLYWLDLVFGLLEGWWLFDDGRSHCIADEQFWKKSMQAAGFSDVIWTKVLVDGKRPNPQVIVGTTE
ncbi:conidial pigment biosynthesis oxidase Arb2/brown2 [Purpureocillium lavendulum]|uniref:Conidial pigment biosynthesis oxidase Arb2/brown2 n=1 Tax=Purpureocillium lavendulum TaxID=1247861 RepID=A0AB34G1L7_9HYPO|nr:conidial pigment biosynthesis oxidase Arb2/brown2 [Purpureocillium lavendulum]